MKLLNIITLSLVFLLGSCVDPNERPTTANPHRMELNNEAKYFDQNYKVYTLEGCEYIVVGAGRSQWGSHKGNCKNPIHKYESTNN
jgi:hypothetical protein